MVLRLNISARAEAELCRRAAQAGLDVAEYTERQVEQMAVGSPTLDEISGPAREEFAASGMSDEEFGLFLEGAKHEMRKDGERAS